MDNLNPLFSGLSFFLDLRTMSKICKVIFVQPVSYLCQNQIVEFASTAIRHYCLPDHGNRGVEESEIEDTNRRQKCNAMQCYKRKLNIKQPFNRVSNQVGSSINLSFNECGLTLEGAMREYFICPFQKNEDGPI